MPPSADAGPWTALPLFPLGTVLFPGGLLPLKVFEARYLDLIGRCLRTQEPFGVVCLKQGSEVRGVDSEPVRFESIGVLARLVDVDAHEPGILRVSCTGEQRFQLAQSHQRADGLWCGQVRMLAADASLAPPAELAQTVAALSNAIEALQAQGQLPFAEPHRLDDAGWVGCSSFPATMSPVFSCWPVSSCLRRYCCWPGVSAAGGRSLHDG